MSDNIGCIIFIIKMGSSSSICKSCRRNEDNSEICIAFHKPEKVEQNPVITQMHMSVDYFKDVSNSRKKSQSSLCLGKKESCLNLNKSEFINEKKSKITDYYDLLEVIGEGIELSRSVWESETCQTQAF